MSSRCAQCFDSGSMAMHDNLTRKDITHEELLSRKLSTGKFLGPNASCVLFVTTLTFIITGFISLFALNVPATSERWVQQYTPTSQKYHHNIPEFDSRRQVFGSADFNMNDLDNNRKDESRGHKAGAVLCTVSKARHDRIYFRFHSCSPSSNILERGFYNDRISICFRQLIRLK